MTLVPDLAAPIAGWRVWNVMDLGRGPELVSPVRPLPWSHRERTTATCSAGCEPCPSWECHCGLYATADLGPLSLAHRGGATVLGCTALWGHVVEHDDGWRGEHGYPLVLLVISVVPDLDPVRVPGRRLRRLSRGFTAEVEGLAGVEALARDLARLYAVPAHPAPSLLRDRPGSWTDAGAAAAVRTEATDGLPGRRSGDPAAHDRLTRCVRDLLDSTAG